MRRCTPLLALLLLAGCAATHGASEIVPAGDRDAEQIDRDKYECGLHAQRATGMDGAARHRAGLYGLVGAGMAGAALGAIGGAIVGNAAGGAGIGGVLGGGIGAPLVGTVKPALDERDYEVVYRACLAERGWQLLPPGAPAAKD